jgi:hypothetical protein
MDKIRYYCGTQTQTRFCMAKQFFVSGRIGKWAYALMEYDLAYELFRSMKGQVVADL